MKERRSVRFAAEIAVTVTALLGMLTVAPAQAMGDTAKAVELPKAPRALRDLGRRLAGRWRCSGQSLGPDGKMVPMTATEELGLELDGFWLHNRYVASTGGITFHFEEYTTVYDKAGGWRRVMIQSGGRLGTGKSAGPHDGKMDWDISTDAMSGSALFRDHEDWSDPGGTFSAWGELSTDNGKTWTRTYEQHCKR